MLAVAFVCFAIGWVGGGDAKLAAVTALWLGWASTVEFIAIASLFGGVLTCLLLAFRRSVLPAFIIRQPWVQRLHDTGRACHTASRWLPPGSPSIRTPSG